MIYPHAKDSRVPGAFAAPLFLAAVAGLALFGIMSGCKSAPPADVPGEFTFHGKAVHPAAVSALYNSTTGQIDLAAFKTDLEAREWEDQPGWWTTDFEEDPTSGRSPFFAYAAFAGPIGGGAELYVLSIIFNQGETADVDNIVLLQKNGNWLSLIRAWNEGSACNGGISNQRMDNDNFLYSRELTPPDLLGLSAGAALTLAPNEDLEATNESCFASANYVYNLTQDSEDLVSVRLYDEPVQDEKGRTERYRYQSCFNRVFNDYVARGKTALTPKEVDELALRFKNECVKPAAPAPVPPAIEK
jgi:hypothetical protein